MELEDTSVSMTDDQAQVLEGAIEIYKAKEDKRSEFCEGVEKTGRK